MRFYIKILCAFISIAINYSTNVNAQVVEVRYDTYSQLELPNYTNQNTLVISSDQGNLDLLNEEDVLGIENVIIRNVSITDTLIHGINKLDIVNVQLYNVTGNVELFLSAFMDMPRARVLKIHNVDAECLLSENIHWSSLKRLEISNCNILSISDVLRQMVDIRYLSITNSKIESISFDTIFSFLVFLDLSYCSFDDIPFSIKNCPNLECFRFYGNKLQQGDCSGLQNNKKLREVHLGDCGIDRFPTALIDLPKIQVLVLDGNHIENIPAEISSFKELKYLSLGRTSYMLNKEIIDGLNVSFVIGKYLD